MCLLDLGLHCELYGTVSQSSHTGVNPAGGGQCLCLPGRTGDAADCTSFALQIKLMGSLLHYKLCREQRPQG